MFKVGIDVGGTFTDIVVQDQHARLHQGKAPSTPGRESEGVIDALTLMAERLDLELADFLREIDVINFGTTVATNAMLQHRGVPTAMITTKGFRDVLELRRGHKEVLFDIRLQPPEEIVPRRWRRVVRERIGAEGEVVTPLDEEEARATIKSIRDEGISSVAVCFLNSYLNPAHEQRMAELLTEFHPDAEVHLSSDVLPKVREFERFSTTVVNAFITPLLRSYLEELVGELRKRGFENQLLVMQSNGGIAKPDHAGRLGCAALLSGPAGGVAAATRIGQACGQENVIGVDMGGTSYDVCLIRDATPETRTDTWFSRQFVGIPMLNVHTIGAGGGSIAWVDQGGALRVGPQSAGARPGPACYGFEGTEPTVTDAFVYLGYLNPDFFLGGRMTIDPDRAAESIRVRVAEPLEMDMDEAAFSILRILNNNLANGIRFVSVAEGHDPRDFSLMSFGGAGSITVGTQARDLGIATVLVPRMASVFCAVGELFADLRLSQMHALAGPATDVDSGALANALDDLARGPVSELEAVPGVETVAKERAAEMRYRGQVHELATPMPDDSAGGMDDVLTATIERFHTLHEQLYAFEMREKPVEILAVRQDLVGRRRWTLPKFDGADDEGQDAAIKAQRQVCFPEGTGFEWLSTPIYDGERLRPGHEVIGPAVIEEVDTTVVVQPGDRVRLNEYLVYEMYIAREDSNVS